MNRLLVESCTASWDTITEDESNDEVGLYKERVSVGASILTILCSLL